MSPNALTSATDRWIIQINHRRRASKPPSGILQQDVLLGVKRNSLVTADVGIMPSAPVLASATSVPFPALDQSAA